MDTKALRQKILDLAIHGKLVPQDPNDEPASVLLERIRAEKERLIKEGKIKKGKKSAKTSDKPHYPFELPKGWVWCKLEDIAYDLMYGTSEKSSRLGKVPVLRMGNINREGGLDWKDLVYSNNEEDIEKFKLLHNDLLFNRTNSSEWVGKTAIYKGERPAIYAGYIIRLRTIFVNADYINFVMNSQYHRNWCNDVKTDAVNQSNINAQKLSIFRVPLPPIEEQKRIVKEIKRWLSLIKAIKNGKENLQESIKQIKSKVLDLAIHGKLVPQDPNDEPASELLKRINPKAEITCDTPQYGKLPKGWCETHIGDAFKVTMGQSPDGSSLNPIDGMEFHQGKILFGNKYLRKSSVLTNSPTKIADADTLLLCVRAPVGVVNITKQRICIGRGLCCLTPTKAINLDYAFYMLTTFQEKFESQSTGSTFKAISGSIIKNEQLWLPPLSEQHRIVAKIEELFAQLDKIEASL